MCRYLLRVRDTVREAMAVSGSDQVVLVGHSAGGWLARAFLGDPQWFVGDAGQKAGAGQVSEKPNPAVAALVTLGTPQLPPPVGAPIPQKRYPLRRSPGPFCAAFTLLRSASVAGMLCYHPALTGNLHCTCAYS